MHQSLGGRLRERREQQQISLTTIAEQTKIKASLLEELERDDISHWPIGIFRRSFIRASVPQFSRHSALASTVSASSTFSVPSGEDAT